MNDPGYMLIRVDLQGARAAAGEAKVLQAQIASTGKTTAAAGAAAATSATRTQRLANAWQTMARQAKQAGMVLGFAGGYVMYKSVTAAVNLNEQINKSAVVFGAHGDEVTNWSKDLADSFGISRRAALEYAGTFGNIFVPMGLARQKAADMSKTMVELAADMASFNNTTPEEALEALRSGIVGETEPLRRYGILLNETRMAQQAKAMGLGKTTEQLDEQEKALARYALIMKDTKDTQGDFARTSDSLANQQRILGAQLEDLAADLGQMVLPRLQEAVNEITGILGDDKLSSEEKTKGIIDVFEGISADAVKALDEGAPEILDAAGHLGVDVASALFHGVIESSWIGKLAAGLWLGSKLTGGKLMATVLGAGLKVGGWFGRKVAERVGLWLIGTGIADSVINTFGPTGKIATKVGPRARMAGMTLGKWMGRGIAIGLILAIPLIADDLFNLGKDIGELIEGGIDDAMDLFKDTKTITTSPLGLTMEEMMAQGLSKSEAFEAAEAQHDENFPQGGRGGKDRKRRRSLAEGVAAAAAKDRQSRMAGDSTSPLGMRRGEDGDLHAYLIVDGEKMAETVFRHAESKKARK